MKKTIKRSLITGLITGLAALVLSCQTYKPLKPSRPHLEYKEGGGHTYQITHIEGKQDLNELARTAIKEDCYIYFDNYWIDIGINEEAKRAIADFEIILNSEKARNLPEGSKIYWYHFHPIKTLKKNGIHPPSFYDIYAHVLAKRVFKDKLGLDVISNVFDRYGKWEFDVGKEYDFPIQKHFLSKVSFIISCLNYELSNSDSSKEKRITNYIEEVKEIGVFLKYEDYKDNAWLENKENK